MGDDDDELNINRTTVGDHGTQGAEHFLIVYFVGANDAGAASGGHLTFGRFASFGASTLVRKWLAKMTKMAVLAKMTKMTQKARLHKTAIYGAI